MLLPSPCARGWGRRVAALAMLVTLAAPAYAISDPAERLPNPAQEARAVELGGQLRCLVCQNESIEDSGADLARDLRHIVRERVAAGQSDPEIVAWMTARYGDFVRLKPPFTPLTALLWASPLVAVLAGAAAFWASRRAPPAPVAALTPTEQTRLRDLLNS